HPQVTITVEQKSADSYFQDVKDAWAQDQGPDIVTIPNTDLTTWQEFLTAEPRETKVATVQTRKVLFRKETSVVLATTSMLTPHQIRSDFVDIVGKDVISVDDKTKAEKVYGLPLAMDTLLLFANRDLLSSAGIAEPAKTWSEFAAQIPK